MYTSLNVKYP